MKYRISWVTVHGARGMRVLSEKEAFELCKTLFLNKYTFSVEPEPVWHQSQGGL